MTERLIAEYADVAPAGTVIRCVARSRQLLLRSGVRHGLLAATEGAVRTRLAAAIPVEASA